MLMIHRNRTNSCVHLCNAQKPLLLSLRQNRKLLRKCEFAHVIFHLLAPLPETNSEELRNDLVMGMKWAFTDWAPISTYSKVLFTDSDVLVRKNLNVLFARESCGIGSAFCAVPCVLPKPATVLAASGRREGSRGVFSAEGPAIVDSRP